MSFFSSIEMLPKDPIFKLPAIFAADTKEKKVNLGIGTYKNEEGKPYVLASVMLAERMILEKQLNKEYLPIDGDVAFVKASLKLIFGKELCLQLGERLYAAQAVGGTSALRIAGDFLSQIAPSINLPNPTWPNHHLIFRNARMANQTYPYYDSHLHEIDFPKFLDAIKSMPEGSVILLHACCHNPTGMDPTKEQWAELSTLIKKRKLIPLFDFAYQGFGEGLEADAWPIRYFAQEGHELFVAYSFAKNFGLYGERVGLVAALTNNSEVTSRLSSHVRQIIRGTYSNPPLQGCRIVAEILQSDYLTHQWQEELNQMLVRIKEMRLQLVKGLEKRLGNDFSFIRKQKGMFSFTDMNAKQVDLLRQNYGIHLTDDGRANIAGLNSSNIDYVIASMLDIYKK